MTIRRLRLAEIAICSLVLVASATAIAALRHSDPTPGETCVANVKSMTAGALMYANDSDGGLPLKKMWSSTLSPYLKNKAIIHCPSVAEGAVGYGYNFVCSSHNLSQLGKLEKMASFFDTVHTQKDFVSTLVELPRPGRHEGKDTVGYLDGHVVAMELKR